MSVENNNDYDIGSIKVLHGLEAVRKRPGMYIGDTDDGSGLHHMVFEAVDNSIDEALAGFCNHIEVTVHEDGSVSCADNGRGIPVAMHPEEHVSAAEVVMTVLHAGGKFDSNSYKVSGGLHGVGISVVNALSDRLELTIKREGHIWQQVYLDGGKPEAPLHIIGDSEETGTMVRFWPSPSIFSNTTFIFGNFAKRLRELSFLNSGIKITLTDLRDDPAKQEVFHHEGGIGEFISYLNKGKKALNKNVIHFTKACDNYISVEIGLQWTDAYTENVYCFTNNVPQRDGGTHLAGFKRALTSTFNSFLEKQGYTKKFKVSTSGDDAREGLTAVISVKMPDPKFSSQTKDKLVSSEATSAVATSVSENLEYFLQENPKDADLICGKIIETARVRDAMRKARDLSRKNSTIGLNVAPDKLVKCREKDPALSEIFLVEGDSAGGSAKNGRDSKFQAILPLRGKILNVEKASFDKIINSQQIGTLVSAFECGIGKDEYNPDKFRYHNVIIMTDADVDGAHIRILLLTFFYRHMPELIERGYVYVAQPPLYKYQKGKQVTYVLSDKEALQYKTNMAVEAGSLFVNKEAAPISGEALESLFQDYNKVMSIMGKLSQKFDKDIIINLMNYKLLTHDIQASESDTKAWAEGFVQLLPKNNAEGVFYKSDVRHDAINNTNYPVLIHHVHGIDYRYELDEAFLSSSDFILLKNMNSKICGLIESSGFIKVGETEYPVKNFHEAYEFLMKQGFTGVKIQRYKGLGEMSPEQLSETTMNPDTRTLLKVSVTDAMEANRLFEELMGENVENRKIFIAENASKATIDI